MIKIIAGVYGHKENGIITPKDKDSEPFSLNPEREAELVARGIAEYANVIIPEPDRDPGTGENADEEPQADVQPDENQSAEDPEETDETQTDTAQEGNDEPAQEEKLEKPEYSDKMKLTELQELAATYELDAQNMRTKAEVIKLLDEYFTEDDTEEPPAFGAMDPIE
ncbi:hypothetical protein [Lacrimispora defluvii]|uniref:Rho termination factor N-terminal domain-containing protein n=1 Tax=Lacrimispora defluvii TaxID=2719233 RepID=A0ABX1VQK1_9FIRM|nr:hypothetical protein [Lacrimispora defluvii]NNJ30094.1 hypothetical protein [Lacrimispora defluvii]